MKKTFTKLLLVLLICALMMTVVGCTHTHQYTEETTKAPTCTEVGVKTFTCSCGESYTEDIEKLPHTEQTIDAVDPDCDSTGLTEGKKCSVCDTIIVEQTTVDALGHTVVIDEAVAPTCTQTGLTEGKHCSVCNEVLVAQTVVDALGHDMDQGTVTTAATCTTDGIKTFACQRDNCDHTTTEVIPATGHTEVVDDAVAPTCTTTGLTEGKHCSACGEVLVAQETVNALGHTEETVAGKAPTCTETGLTDGKKCSVCNETLTAQTEISALGHTEVVDDAVAPTCTTTGLTAGKHCSACGEVLVAQTVVDALGHTEETVAGKAPTCTETGLTDGKKCSVCNETLTAQTEISALGHTEVVDAAAAPTCTATGLTAGKHCSVCNEVLVAQTVVDALGHTAGEAVEENIVVPTCTEDGSHDAVVYCSVCDEEISRETVVDAKLDHDWGDWKQTTAPTCSALGKDTRVCERNAEHVETREVAIDAEAHSWNEGEVTKAATCTSKGVKTYTCEYDASHIKTESVAIDPNAHDIRIVAAIPATCTSEGKTEGQYCANGCEKQTIAQTVTPKLPHTYDDDADLDCNVCGTVRDCLHAETVVVLGKAATCTEAGLTDGEKCSVCDDITIAQESIPATYHQNQIKIPAVDATCTTAGSTEGLKCYDCGTIITEPIEVESPGHKYSTEWTTGSTDHWHACTVCGDKADLSNHAYTTEVEGSRVNASCEADGKYTLECECGATKVVVLTSTGHNYNAVVTAPTCTEAGHTTHTCANCSNSYKDDYTDAIKHNYVGVVTTEPTCTETGVKTYTCQNDKTHTYTEEVDALEHNYVGVVTTEPTCTETGVKTYTCQNDKTHTYTEEVASLGHDKVSHEAQAPTCTEIGWEAYETCSRCAYTTYKEIAATDHAYDAVVTAPTCENKGYTTYTCHCGDTYTADEVDALEHNYVGVVTTEPTCTETGVKTYTCQNDKTHTYTEEVDALEHNYVGVVTTEPTCTETGVKTYTCQNDKTHTYTEEVASLGHDKVSHEAQASTCTEIGWEAYETCSRCAYTTYKEIAAADHTWQDVEGQNATCTEDGYTAYQKCSVCDEEQNKEVITASGHSYDNDQDTDCNNGCGTTRQVAPVFNSKVVDETITEICDVLHLNGATTFETDLAKFVTNNSGLELGYTVELNGNKWNTSTLSFTIVDWLKATGEALPTGNTYTGTVTVSYTLGDEEQTISCNYQITFKDSTSLSLANGGFENGLEGWTLVGNIGDVSSNGSYWNGEFGMDGEKMFSAYEPTDLESNVGTLTSPTFTLNGSGWVTFKVGAMKDGNYVYVDVVDADTGVILARYYNGLWKDNETHCTLVAYKADLSAFVGKDLFFRISDNADSGYGLFFADSFITYYDIEPEGFNNATPVDYTVYGTIYDLFNGGFELGGNQGWWNVGEPGAVTNADLFFSGVAYGKEGNFLYSGVEDAFYNEGGELVKAGNGREGNTGALTSSVFEIGGKGYISYMLGGGNDICYVQVIDSTTGEVLARFRQQAREDAVLKTYVADLSKYIGRTVRIQLVDNATSNWGCVSFDNVVTYYTSTDALPEGALTANNILADKTALNEELALEVTVQGDYTADSFHAYRQKFDTAYALVNNIDVSQTDVDNATNALREARLALTVRPVEEVADADKNVRLMSGNEQQITLTDYVNTNDLSNITYSIQSSNAVVTLSEIVDSKFTITAGDVAETTNVTVTITVSYNGEQKLTVELAVVVTNDVAPTLKQSEVVHNVDTVVAESVTIDFATNVENLGNLDLTYSAKHGETDLVLAEGSTYTFTLGTYQEEISYETFTVTVSYTANGESNTLEYTYKLKLVDTTKYRMVNGGFEDGLNGWTVVGNIGDVDTATHYWVGDGECADGFAFGMDGTQMFSAYAPGATEASVGTLTSPTFTVGGSGFVTFKIGALRDQNYAYIDVVDADTGAILVRYYNGLWAERTNDTKSGCTLIAYKADLSAFEGKQVFFRISDNADSGYGLFFADSFVTYYDVEPTDGFSDATKVGYEVSGTIYDLFNGGFEMGGLQGWWSIGEIGLVTNANGYWGDNISYEKVGDYLFTGVESNGADTMREGNKGTLTSSVFELGGSGYISFKLGGGGNALCYVQVIDSTTGEVLARYHQQAQQDAKLIQYVADLSAYIGKTVRIQVVDYASADWGCVSFDNVVTYYATTESLPTGETANNIFHGNYDVTNGSFETGNLDGWTMNIWEAGSQSTLGWVESSEHDADWYTKNDGRKDGNFLFTFCKPDGTNCENTKGELVSSTFALKQNAFVSFRFGGAGTRDVYVQLVRADGTVIATFYNEADGKANTEMYAYYYQYTGETADCFFRVVDNSTSNYGCFVVDDFRVNLDAAPDGFIAAIQ